MQKETPNYVEHCATYKELLWTATTHGSGPWSLVAANMGPRSANCVTDWQEISSSKHFMRVRANFRGGFLLPLSISKLRWLMIIYWLIFHAWECALILRVESHAWHLNITWHRVVLVVISKCSQQKMRLISGRVSGLKSILRRVEGHLLDITSQTNYHLIGY